jgi:hypothetical protein
MYFASARVSHASSSANETGQANKRAVMRPRFVPFVAMLTLICFQKEVPAEAANPLAESLIHDGVKFTSGEAVCLPAPSMADGLDAGGQRDVMAKVAAKYTLEQFLRDSPVTPFPMKIEPVKNAGGQRIGQRVDIWFVAYGDLAALLDKRLLDGLMSIGKSANASFGKPHSLTDAELLKREIKVDGPDGSKQTFVWFAVPILEKVELSGVNHQVLVKSGNSILAASVLDPRFTGDAEFPNQWKELVRDPDGKLIPGKARPYTGSGQYIKVTPLVTSEGKPGGALFVEAHLVFHEPKEWFGGANLLGSKLPLALQDSVRDFRRAMKQLEGNSR